jgi:hypothetical protein
MGIDDALNPIKPIYIYGQYMGINDVLNIWTIHGVTGKVPATPKVLPMPRSRTSAGVAAVRLRRCCHAPSNCSRSCTKTGATKEPPGTYAIIKDN